MMASRINSMALAQRVRLLFLIGSEFRDSTVQRAVSPFKRSCQRNRFNQSLTQTSSPESGRAPVAFPFGESSSAQIHLYRLIALVAGEFKQLIRLEPEPRA